MSNIFAYIVLLGFPFLAYLLWRRKPLAVAVCNIFLFGMLFLPVQTAINFPLIVTIDRYFIIAVTGLYFVSRHGIGLTNLVPKNRLYIFLILGTLFFPFFTVLNNADGYAVSVNYFPGLTFYDFGSIIQNHAVMLLPFLIGYVVLRQEHHYQYLFRTIVKLAILYCVLALYETLTIPLLHEWVYGFFPEAIARQRRGTGFKPIVFLGYGLLVSFFIFTAILACVGSWRAKLKKIPRFSWQFLIFYFAITLALAKSLGAVLLAVFFVPVAIYLRSATIMRVAGLCMIFVMMYPVIRDFSWVPTKILVEQLEPYAPKRAGSFGVRLDHEAQLQARAQEKPLFGWGIWGRNNTYDPLTGKQSLIQDGYWIIILGQFGWAGFICIFGLLCFPTIALFLHYLRRIEAPPITISIACLMMAVNCMELIPNASIFPITWLLTGGILGYLQEVQRRVRQSTPYAVQAFKKPHAPNPVASAPMPQPLRHDPIIHHSASDTLAQVDLPPSSPMPQFIVPLHRPIAHKDVNLSRVGCVIIGRNEGWRLQECLRSLHALTPRLVYVDSGSTDGSPHLAQQFGAHVVMLDRSVPFSAARARNAGFKALMARHEALSYVQFIDGDCQLHAQWLPAALAHFQGRERLAVVCGRRREWFPDNSVYNLLCDLEWDTPLGMTQACGGDALIRVEAFARIGGYDPAFVAGEEPELCLRLRRAGWLIERIDVDMTWHDAAIRSMDAWWKRAKRYGYALGLSVGKHGREFYKVRPSIRALAWTIGLPMVAIGLSVLQPWTMLLLFAYPLQIVRLALMDRSGRPKRWTRASLTLASRFAETAGLLKYLRDRSFSQRPELMEYK